MEGGLGAYQLGSRGSMSGYVPPPGQYFDIDVIWFDGEVDIVSLGGAVLTDVEVTGTIIKPNMTWAFDSDVISGTPAINIQLPFASADIDFSSVLGANVVNLKDDESGFGDPVFTGMVGWHDDNWHHNLGASLFVPWGKYDPSSIDPATRSIDVLSTGKNKYALQPFANLTYLNPKTGREASGSISLTFNEENPATNYKTGTEFIFEGALAQNLPNGWRLGLGAYHYNQLSDDSGEGAENFKQTIGVSSLKARVSGLGLIANYSTKVYGRSASILGRYYNEFNAKNRFESRQFWLSFSTVF